MREEFLANTKRVLQDRAGSFCSNPECFILTSGPSVNDSRAARSGIACHITAASPKGPRYDPNMTTEERTSSKNGIWLCSQCSREIDSDPERFPTTLLHEWKNCAEYIVDFFKQKRMSLNQIIDLVLQSNEGAWKCTHLSLIHI